MKHDLIIEKHMEMVLLVQHNMMNFFYAPVMTVFALYHAHKNELYLENGVVWLEDMKAQLTTINMDIVTARKWVKVRKFFNYVAWQHL